MRLFRKVELEATIIATGDTAVAVGTELIKGFKSYEVKLRSLAVLTGPKKKPKSKTFDELFYLSDNLMGYARDYDKARIAVKERREQLIKVLRGLVKKKVDLFVILATSGGTSSASAIEIAKLLKEEFGVVPTIFYLIPSLTENSRSLYNAAMFLDEALYNKRIGLRLPVILTDNKPFSYEGNREFVKVKTKKEALIPSALLDLLASSILEPQSIEFDAKLLDLLATIKRPGLSVFVSRELGQTEEGKSISRISDLLLDDVKQITQLAKEDIFEAKSMYISVFDLDLDFQALFEARKLISSYKATKPSLKYVKSTEEPKPRFRAVIADLPIPPRIIKLMQMARDNRKRIILKERELQEEQDKLDIETVHSLEDQLHEKWIQSK